jgi:Na+/H+ antiporter NhaD/arsenite permease-like protein
VPLCMMFGFSVAIIVEVIILYLGGPFSTILFYLVSVIAAIALYIITRKRFASKRKA